MGALLGLTFGLGLLLIWQSALGPRRRHGTRRGPRVVQPPAGASTGRLRLRRRCGYPASFGSRCAWGVKATRPSTHMRAIPPAWAARTYVLVGNLAVPWRGLRRNDTQHCAGGWARLPGNRQTGRTGCSIVKRVGALSQSPLKRERISRLSRNVVCSHVVGRRTPGIHRAAAGCRRCPVPRRDHRGPCG